MTNPITFFILIGLYPVIFLVSKNWFVYETKQLVFLLVIPVITGMVGLIGVYASTFLKRLISQGIRRFLISLAGFCLLYLVFGATIAASRVAFFGFIAVAVASCFLARKSGFYLINLLFVVMTLLASAELVYSVGTKSVKTDYLVPTLNEEADDKIKFVTKPNIYLIHLESYHSPEAMKRIYNFDNQNFVDELKNREFFVSQNNFSNYINTLNSVGAIFLQQHHYYSRASGVEDSVGMRDMIGGKLYNPTLSILKNNGYMISYIHPSTYSFIGNSYLDYYYPTSKIYDSLLIFQNVRITKLHDILFGATDPNKRKLEYSDEDDFYRVLHAEIETERENTKPTFYFIKEPLKVNHTPSRGKYTWEQSEDGWVDTYVQSVKDSNPKILDTVDRIIESDPTAVIILYGDHGAWRYKNIWVDGSGRIDETIYERRQLSMDELALDLFGIITAVRYPNGDPSILDNETFVNMFRILFAELSGSEAPTAKQEDASFIKYLGNVYKIVENGKALERAEIVEVP